MKLLKLIFFTLFNISLVLAQKVNNEKIVVLDVCMGLGYNTGCILEELLQRNIKIEWHGLEIDQKPLNLGLDEKIFQENLIQLILVPLKKLLEIRI